MQEKYNTLSDEYAISARTYFMVLRLAIYHLTGEYLETSVEIADAEKSEEVWKLGCEILKTLYKNKEK